MKATLVFVPPGGGEADYQLDFELPGVPQPGDYISIMHPGNPGEGTSDFIVRRTWWHLTHSRASGAVGSVRDLFVECEFAKGPRSSLPHISSLRIYEKRTGGEWLEFEASTY